MKRVTATLFVLYASLGLAQEVKKDSTTPSKEIQEITIERRKKLVEKKVDRIVFNVENSVKATGGDALDALKATPNVQVRNENISITGKNSIQIMVNDKIIQLGGAELTNYLKSIASENIQKIEVITTPPSKYDAEGNGGLINIVLKKPKYDNWNTTLRSSYRQGMVASFRNGANFSYRKNKFSVLADLGYNFGNSLYQNDIHFWYPKEYWVNWLEDKDANSSWSPLLNLNYDLTDKSTIGVQFSSSFYKDNQKQSAQNKAYSYDNSDLTKYYSTNGEEHSNIGTTSFNINLLQKFGEKGAKLTADADYFGYRKENNADLMTTFHNYTLGTAPQVATDNYASQKINNYSLKTDVVLPVSWGNLSFGAKIAQTQTDNIAQTEFRDENHTLNFDYKDHFLYTENTQAVYADWTKSFGEKWSVKAGLRGENTQSKGVSVVENKTHKREFFKLFPTIFAQYKASENHNWSLTMNRRIMRPQFFSLNPGRLYMNPKSYVVGNPFLQPSYSTGVFLGYSYKNWLNIEAQYIRHQDHRSQITYHNPDKDEAVMKWENYSNGSEWALSFNINKNILPWWEISANGWVNYTHFQSYIALYPDDLIGWSSYQSLNNALMLNKAKTLQANVSYQYVLPWDNGTAKGSGASSLDFGIKYLMFDKKLTLALNVNDVLKTNIMTYSTRYKTQGIRDSYRQYYDSRFVRLSLSYKFGNSKISVQQRQGGNAEEKGRSN